MSRRPKRVIIVNTGEEFDSVGECARRLGVGQSYVSNVLTGRQDLVLGMFVQYLEDQTRQIEVVETGETFDDIRECSMRTDVPVVNIRSVLSGFWKMAGGYRFKYVD